MMAGGSQADCTCPAEDHDHACKEPRSPPEIQAVREAVFVSLREADLVASKVQQICIE